MLYKESLETLKAGTMGCWQLLSLCLGEWGFLCLQVKNLKMMTAHFILYKW